MLNLNFTKGEKFDFKFEKGQNLNLKKAKNLIYERLNAQP